MSFRSASGSRQQHLAGLLHVLEPQRVLALDQLVEAGEELLGERDPLRLTGDEEDVAPLSDMDPEPLLDQLEVLAPPSGERPCTIVVQQLQPRGRFSPITPRRPPGPALLNLIKRRQQDKPLRRAAVVIRARGQGSGGPAPSPAARPPARAARPDTRRARSGRARARSPAGPSGRARAPAPPRRGVPKAPRAPTRARRHQARTSSNVATKNATVSAMRTNAPVRASALPSSPRPLASALAPRGGGTALR